MSNLLIAGLFNSPSWQAFMSNDLNRGFVTGFVVATVLGIMLLILWLVLNLTVFSHRASAVKVTNEEGDIVVARTAIAEAIERELDGFPALRLLRVRLFKYNMDYRMTLNCEFRSASGLLEVVEQIRPKLKSALRRIFGVDNVLTISIVVERYTAPKTKSAPPAENAPDKEEPEKAEPKEEKAEKEKSED